MYHQNKYLEFSSANFTLNFTSAPGAQSCPLFIHTNMWRGRKEPHVKYPVATWNKSHPNINPLNNPCQSPPNIHTLLPSLSISKKIRSFFSRTESVNDEQACTLTKEQNFCMDVFKAGQLGQKYKNKELTKESCFYNANFPKQSDLIWKRCILSYILSINRIL